jgi:hypothetical protein
MLGVENAVVRQRSTAGSPPRVLVALIVFIATTAVAIPRDDLSVTDLKARLSSASVSDRPHLCVQIAEMQLGESDRFYAASDVEKAQAALTDVVAYSELARDYAIQSHKYQKQTEIAARSMTRKLTNIVHLLAHEDQAPVRDAINRLERVRDDLLASMFKKGSK